MSPDQLDEIMHSMVDPSSEKEAELLAKGLPAGPGGGVGQVVFSADIAEQWAKKGLDVILVRNETSPEDVHGMHAAKAILTAKGGMTSHAALVARGWGKCCIVGCSALQINYSDSEMRIDDKIIKEGDWLTLNGSTGKIYNGQLNLIEPDLSSNKYYGILMDMTDNVKRLGIRANAESPDDAKQARDFGAKGIGLCRTEHMFFDPERILAVREMIIATEVSKRREAIMKLLPFQREDFKGILAAMSPYPVTIRLLDPPLHEFMTLNSQQKDELAKELDISLEALENRVRGLEELNPMLGHRGCRLGIAYPEITEMQSRAIFEATAELIKDNAKKIIDSAKQYNSYNAFEKLMQEYDLSSDEGIVLMCLAEALLRIPDSKTINDLIEDKLRATEAADKPCFLRKIRKAQLINEFLKENKVQCIIADHWKSLELIKSDVKKICLIHSKEINHAKGTRLNRRVLNALNNADTIVSNSNYTKSLAINIGVNPEKIIVINPGIH